MKTHLLTILCFLTAYLAPAQQPAPAAGDDTCLIRITVEGFTGGECRFIGINGKQNYLALPELDVEGDYAVVQKDERLPSGLYYFSMPNNKFLQILLDADQRFSLDTKLDDLIGSMAVTGSTDNELFYRNLNYELQYKERFDAIRAKAKPAEATEADTAELTKEREALIEEKRAHVAAFAEDHADSFFTYFKVAGQNPKLQKPLLPDGEVDAKKQLELYKAEYWDHVDFSDARILRTPVYHNKLEQYIKKLTPQNPNAVIEAVEWIMNKAIDNQELFDYTSSYICLTYQKSTMMGGENVFVHMVDNFLLPELTPKIGPEEIKKARQQAAKFRLSMLGKKSNELRARNEKGEYISLHGLKAPMVVLYIYNLDCEHCMEETPEMLDVYHDWKEEGLEVFALCTNQEEDRWRKYIAEQKLDWHNILDPKYESRYHMKYNIDITPEVYVLDPDRKIVGLNLKPTQLDWLFEREFKKIRDEK